MAAQLCTAHNGAVAPHIAPNCPKYERPDMLRTVMDQEARREVRELSDDDLAVYLVRIRRMVVMAEEDGKVGPSEWFALRDLACLEAAEKEGAWRRRATRAGGSAVNRSGWSERVKRVLERTTLLDVVVRDIPLTTKGRDWWGLCPFHREETPSFKVSAERQTFHCFGCGMAGDLFDYYELRFGLDFAAAVRHLDPDPDPASATAGGRRVLPA